MSTTDAPADRSASTRWRLHRAGIVNVYQYENEVLDFAGGRLLLRGVNGSGKSTAMNMLLPFLLTARVRGIDAAGEQTGVLKSWMLSGRDEAQPVGYLWLEFARAGDVADPDDPAVTTSTDERAAAEHLVIGCGIKANRSTDNVTTWWFVTTRRPGIDIELVERGVPLSADALRSALGVDPVFPEPRRGEYRREVNRRLYGGADTESFLDLLNAVRSPRVGDRVDVDLPEYLVAALPGLSEQALTEAARPLDDLDEHRRNVSDLDTTAAGLTAIEEVYRNYVRTEVEREVVAARELLSAADRARRAERADARAATDASVAEAASLAEADRVDSDIVRLTAEITALEKSPAYTEGQQLDDLRNHVTQLRSDVEVAETRVASLRDRLPDAAQAVRRQEQRTDDEHARLVEELAELDGAAAAAALTARPPSAPAVARRPATDDLNSPDGELDTAVVHAKLDALAGSAGLRRADLDEVRVHAATVDREAAEVRAADAAASVAEGNVHDALSAFEQNRAAVDAERNAWHDAVRSWALDRAASVTTPDDAPVVHSLATPETTRPVGDGATIRQALIAEVSAVVDVAQRGVVDAEHDLERARDARAEAQALVDDLAERSEPDPPLLDWQRPGVPGLADLVEFVDHLDAEQRAGLEAALMASGLLTAAVTGRGITLHTGELVARPGRAVDAPLSELLRVAEGSDPDGHVTALLSSISTDPESDAPSVISVDGSFRLGTLRGRHGRPTAEFVGAGARRARLERQRSEAAVALVDAEQRTVESTEFLAARRGDFLDVSAIRADIPSLEPVDRAAAAAEAAQTQLDRARDRLEVVRDMAEDADRRLAAASDELQRIARTLALPTTRDQLDQLGRHLDAIVASVRSTKQTVDTVHRSHGDWASAVVRWRTTVADVSDAERRAAVSRSDHEARSARLATLEDTLGLAYHEVVETIEVSRTDLDAARRMLPTVKEAHTEAVRAHQAAVDAALRSAERRRDAEASCAESHAHLAAVLAVPGLIAAGRDTDTDTDIATGTDTDAGDGTSGGTSGPAGAVADTSAVAETEASVDAFRALIDRAASSVPGPAEGGTTADGVRISLRQRRNALGGGWDAEDRQPDPMLPLSVSVNGPLGQMTLAASVAAVRSQLAQLISLLTQKQDQALRILLQGMIAREVAEKMHHATALVDLMNDRLGSVTTAHGIGVRLRWRRSDDLDDDTKRTVSILAKLPDLRTEAEEADLRDALAARLDEARRLEPDAPYRHLIGQVFDYRRWHDMGILLRRSGDTERRLTRRTPLSEGEKKLVTYLPLFAAVAAACDSIAANGTDTAPRFLLLDDAFAKVSEDNHAALFGLLVDLDLDFIATSERLWGTHATVPALSITEVVRDADLGVILLEHSTWNGRVLT